MATTFLVNELKLDKNLDALKDKYLPQRDLELIGTWQQHNICPPVIDLPNLNDIEIRKIYRDPDVELYRLMNRFPRLFLPWRPIILACRAERNALEAVFRVANGYAWHNNRNWCNPAAPLSSWYGVTTKPVLACIIGRRLIYLERVITLDLSRNNLAPRKLDEESGRLAAEIGQLSCLQKLYLNNNFLRGKLPENLSRLTALTDLRLQFNQFEGSIPSSLSKLIRLTRLQLDHNRFEGYIPPALSSLTQLEGLFLHCNNLGNQIRLYRPRPGRPFERFTDRIITAGKVSGIRIREQEVRDYYLNDAKRYEIHPPVRESIAIMEELLIRRVSTNIPPSFVNLSKLKELTVYGNHLNGSVDSTLKKHPYYAQWKLTQYSQQTGFHLSTT
ncbi:MAG: hypothetical protein Q4G42_02115 [Neisseria sp.]|nr:hypothetical protein [Neisseria sp.]